MTKDQIAVLRKLEQAATPGMGGGVVKIEKVTKRTYEVNIFPAEVWNISFGRFKDARNERGQASKRFEKCFICGKKFNEDDIPRIAKVSGKGNMFVCNQCAESADPAE